MPLSRSFLKTKLKTKKRLVSSCILSISSYISLSVSFAFAAYPLGLSMAVSAELSRL